MHPRISFYTIANFCFGEGYFHHSSCIPSQDWTYKIYILGVRGHSDPKGFIHFLKPKRKLIQIKTCIIANSGFWVKLTAPWMCFTYRTNVIYLVWAHPLFKSWFMISAIVNKQTFIHWLCFDKMGSLYLCKVNAYNTVAKMDPEWYLPKFTFILFLLFQLLFTNYMPQPSGF